MNLKKCVVCDVIKMAALSHVFAEEDTPKTIKPAAQTLPSFTIIFNTHPGFLWKRFSWYRGQTAFRCLSAGAYHNQSAFGVCWQLSES